MVALTVLAVAQLRSQLRGSTAVSASMANTIEPGDRVAAWLSQPVRRGDLVIERAPADPADVVYRRVIGLPGDTVVCCNRQGLITVNDKALHETYLYPGARPSQVRFAVKLRPGQAWLLGDNRAVADDSRFTGPAAMSSILGRITIIDRGGDNMFVRTPATFVADGLAPADHREVLPVAWLALLGAAPLVLVVMLATGGILRLRRRNLRRPVPAPAPA